MKENKYLCNRQHIKRKSNRRFITLLFQIFTKPLNIVQTFTPDSIFRSRYERFRRKFSNFAAKQPLTMEQKFGKNSIDIKVLREFCEREGKEVTYRKGDQLEREGDPARWFGFVTEGCFKYLR